MNKNVVICLVYFVKFIVISAELLERHPDVDLTITERIAKYGYPVEVHNVTTPDGYNLTTHRIPHGKNGKNKPGLPVMLVHGLSGCGDYYTALGDGKALAYFLANRGYDVWLFNSRGTLYGRKHNRLNPDTDKEFWEFSWHEIGSIDIPAHIDYILNATKQEKLFYVGHSQGGTTLYVTLSERPEYNEKLYVSVSMGGPVLGKYIDDPFLKACAAKSKFLEIFSETMDVHEVFSHNDKVNVFLKNACGATTESRDMCAGIMHFVGGNISSLLVKELIPVLASTNPAGYSIYQFIHYMQIVDSGYFRQYDHGLLKNLLLYDTPFPPMYNLRKINSPIALVYSQYDWVSSKKQMDALKRILPNVVMDYMVPHEQFNHLDYVTAYNADKLVYEPIYQLFKKFS